jgi:hypothetical protein
MSEFAVVCTGKVDNALFAKFVRDEHGPIRRDLDRRSLKVYNKAVDECPVHTGKLKATARREQGIEGEKQYTDITFGKEGETDYLGYVLNGTEPHDIYPHQDRPNAHLRFVVGGMIIYAKVVHHPGTRPNNFMERALPLAAS